MPKRWFPLWGRLKRFAGLLFASTALLIALSIPFEGVGSSQQTDGRLPVFVEIRE